MSGFLGKMKQAAGDVVDAAKKGVEQVQEKSRTHQLQGKADEAAKKLGYLIARERGGGPAAGEEADRLVEEIASLERQLAEEARRAEDEAHEQGKAIDPVCGMTVDIEGARFTAEHQGTTYYFCSQGCFERFTADPSAFVTASAGG